MTTLFLLRHGETYANQQGYLQGTMDNSLTSLTFRGRQKVEQCCRELKKLSIDLVITSPLKRALQTSQIICDHNKIPLRVDPRLAEMSYGKWNGLKVQFLKDEFPQFYDWQARDFRPTASQINGGEKASHVHSRITSFLRDCQTDDSDQVILVVTHGWIIKQMVLQYLTTDLNKPLVNPQNLTLTKICLGSSSDRQKVVYYNRPIDCSLQVEG